LFCSISKSHEQEYPASSCSSLLSPCFRFEALGCADSDRLSFGYRNSSLFGSDWIRHLLVALIYVIFGWIEYSSITAGAVSLLFVFDSVYLFDSRQMLMFGVGRLRNVSLGNQEWSR
jgi:hypothetical protein